MKELKEALSFSISLANAIGKSLDDGKIDYGDIMNLWEPMLKAQDAVDGSSKILEEINNLTEDQRSELVKYVESEFDIPQDSIEAVAECGVELVFGLFKIISHVRKI